MTNSMGNQSERSIQLLEGGATPLIIRLALIVSNSGQSHCAHFLRSQLPTFVVADLAELRAALSLHFERQHLLQSAQNEDKMRGMIALDITHLSLEDTALFGSHLWAGCPLGIVYLMKPEQYECFEEGTFDFVVR